MFLEGLKERKKQKVTIFTQIKLISPARTSSLIFLAVHQKLAILSSFTSLVPCYRPGGRTAKFDLCE